MDFEIVQGDDIQDDEDSTFSKIVQDSINVEIVKDSIDTKDDENSIFSKTVQNSMDLEVSVKTTKQLTAVMYVSEMSALELNSKHVQYSTRICSFLEFKPEQICRPCWGESTA
ncbi:hypothetical protein JHK87_044286 [Glycine soja]|nr:hypothetical protein JHK87_044286 [Glycine soja]